MTTKIINLGHFSLPESVPGSFFRTFLLLDQNEKIINEASGEDITYHQFMRGFDIGDICKKDEESTLTENVCKKLEELKFDFSEVDKDEDGKYWSSSKGIVDIWLHLLNHINPSLELKLLKIPAINFYGADKVKRHLETPGYGVFV